MTPAVANLLKCTQTLSQVGMRALTPSTLLIPKHRLGFFTMRKTQMGSINKYFIFLLVKYASRLYELGLFPLHTTQKWKKQYQKSNRKLKKTSFIPDPSAWEAYRQISNHYGVSICHLFTIVMRLDWFDWQMAGCPLEVTKIQEHSEYRKNYPKKPNSTPRGLKNCRKISFSFQKICIEEKTLIRTGRFRN